MPISIRVAYGRWGVVALGFVLPMNRSDDSEANSLVPPRAFWMHARPAVVEMSVVAERGELGDVAGGRIGIAGELTAPDGGATNKVELCRSTNSAAMTTRSAHSEIR